MRRAISIAMVISGLTAALTGIWNFFPPFNTMFYLPHAINASILALLVAIHLWLNRKPLLRYFKRLGGWWILVGLLFVPVIWLGIVLPILIIKGAM